MRTLLMILVTALTLLGVEIRSVSNESATIDRVDLPVGISGVVIHHFDEKHATIVARATLTSPTTIRFRSFSMLAQPNLPRPKILPQKGDEVILGYLFDRGLIIAPDYQTYSTIASSIPARWLHPDLFAAQLAKAKHPAPTREDFANFCDKFALSRIVIALKDEAKVLDCYSFATLQTIPIKSSGAKIKLPFYTRIDKISGSIFDLFGPGEIDNYYTYYSRLTETR